MTNITAKQITNSASELETAITGEFIDKNGERFYRIENVDQMNPFFISVVSDSDHWLFVSSYGGLTAGRVSPEKALFPYETVDKIHDSNLHTGTKTIARVKKADGSVANWEPFNREQDEKFKVTRNLYKNVLGNKLCFEEINHDLQLAFEYTWLSSDQFGFVRHCRIHNLAATQQDIELIDGLQNLLPAGTPRYTQTNSSNLVDAYKWSELEADAGLGMFTLYSGITDRAEPCESLRANTVFALGIDRNNSKVMLSSEQLGAFKRGGTVTEEYVKRGIRSAYLVSQSLQLTATQSHDWYLVANTELSQSQVVALAAQITASEPSALTQQILATVETGSDKLARMMAHADGLQATDQENVSAHHYANVLFNVLRGGIFDDQYRISATDLASTIELFNKGVYQRNAELLNSLDARVELSELLAKVSASGDAQLQRLVQEYLPITFGRRHGDPSRPWNQFAIKLTDDAGNKLLSYQGNWRDIFQNWEALSYSYPQFIESVIAKFVNASTIDGYNPYRITKEGIDWEVEDPEDPWSYIGYWGDHQIIYLQKLLEVSHSFHPGKLSEMMRKDIFSYANVPYRIKPFAEIKQNAKDTVTYDDDLAAVIEQRIADMGADGKLVLDANGNVYQVNLVEKLLVTLLAKLGNLVVGGGIWLNTQRPEWNDANNALVGQGLSMVTLYYMRRYISFMQQLLANESQAVVVSAEVADWLHGTLEILQYTAAQISNGQIDSGQIESDGSAELRYRLVEALGELSSRYRQQVYAQGGFNGKAELSVQAISDLLQTALTAIDYTIGKNRAENGLFEAYNLLELDQAKADVDNLYPMLEGQVAALSSGALSAAEVNDVLQALFTSDVYRDDQKTFMLYPDRNLTHYLAKNSIVREQAEQIPLLISLLQSNNQQVVEVDAQGAVRFNSNLQNIADLHIALAALPEEFLPQAKQDKANVLALYEKTFNHKEFTGRSGGMFGFEGLGCIYWHMVSKLLLAVQECVFSAHDKGEAAEQITQMANWYYKVREGIGFNKTPDEYGAFPTDPYSHTPKHAGAQQPGMTGQVKEEVIARFGELGLRVIDGEAHIAPVLLRPEEFNKKASEFRCLDVADQWHTVSLPENSLGFTWCQVPIVYQLSDNSASQVRVDFADGSSTNIDQLRLTADLVGQIAQRTGKVSQITVVVNSNLLHRG